MKHGRLILFVCAVAALAGCVKYPEPYRPPVQRQSEAIAPEKGLKHYVTMSMPEAPDYLVSDVLPQLMDGTWRWSLKKPTFRFQLPMTKALRLRADIATAGITMQQTGPVKIQVFVEDHLLDTLEFEKADSRTYEKEVPAEWLTTDRPVYVRLEIDKLWKAEGDGAVRGFIINGIGFVQ